MLNHLEGLTQLDPERLDQTERRILAYLSGHSCEGDPDAANEQ